MNDSITVTFYKTENGREVAVRTELCSNWLEADQLIAEEMARGIWSSYTTSSDITQSPS
jgi:hypothetical protein